MTRQFATLVEQDRKLALMSRKSASRSLNFGSPKRKRAALFSPKHRGPQTMPATQEDDDFKYERDSLCSNSSHSTRIRLQDKYRVIDENPAEFPTPMGHKDWIKKHASQIMAQSGNPDNIEPDSEYGGIKKVQVHVYFYFLFACNSPPNLVCM